MAQNEWKTIAHEYRNREHALLSALIELITSNEIDSLYAVPDVVNKHLQSTGRTFETAFKTPENPVPDPDIQRRLLALLGATQGQQEALPKLTKSGKPRKQRSDKGKKRGSYKNVVQKGET